LGDTIINKFEFGMIILNIFKIFTHEMVNMS